MLAEAGSDDAADPRRDPEEAALELLQNELGARRIDGVRLRASTTAAAAARRRRRRSSSLTARTWCS